MIKFLVVEDDRYINNLLCSYLAKKSYDYASCHDGKEALEAFENNPFDMVISDILMPNMNGYELAREIRNISKDVPILFMTALDDRDAQLKGYELGIDDYVVKPFDMEVLMMKVDALLRRANIQKTRKLIVGNLKMSLDEHTAYVNDEELILTRKEFDILFKLLSFPKRIFTRDQLMNEFWGSDSETTTRSVDVHMNRLREKTSICDGFEIKTVRGLGYKAVLK